MSWMCLGQDTITPKAMIHLGYGTQWPVSKALSNRYGAHGVISIGIRIIKKQWETGPSLHFLYGSQVKEDVLAPLRGTDGELIGSDHQIAEVDLKMRGTYVGWSLENSIRINESSKLILGIRPGWLAHWIKFQNPGSTYEPIQGDYRFGYDRLSSGFAIMETMTYRYHSSNRLINFELTCMMTESSLRLRRNIQLDNRAIPSRITSNLFGIQAAWIIPIYSTKNAEHIYY